MGPSIADIGPEVIAFAVLVAVLVALGVAELRDRRK